MNKNAVWALLLLVAFIGAWFGYHWFLLPSGGGLQITGTVEGTELNISAKIASRIARLSLQEGDTIKAGEVVLTLDDADLAAEVRVAAAALDKAKVEVNVAEAVLDNQRAGLESAQAQILVAEADVRKAEIELKDTVRHRDRMTRLYSLKTVPQESYDSAVTAHASTLAAVDSARAKLEAAKAGRRAVEAQLNMALSQVALAQAGTRQAEANLAQWQAKYNDTILKSPLAGIVVYKAAEQGETVTPGMTILTLVDLSRLTVRVDIDESRLGLLGINDKVTLHPIGNNGKSIRGHIAAINRYADFATQKDVTGGREDIRTFRVSIAVDETESGLFPGMTVKVTIPEKTEAGNAR
nr:HlyD family efflux transporter periplasmic adaptor subunit [uncultured Desulfobulbus sp.]